MPRPAPGQRAAPLHAMPSQYQDSRFDRQPIREIRIPDWSWTYIEARQPKLIKLHDIVKILVDEKSNANVDSKFNRQRTANLKAELKDFFRIGKTGNLATAAENQPGTDANLTGRLNSTGGQTNREGVTFRIAATVVDVLPNGNVVLEARKTIRSDHEVWQFSLTGVIRSEDIDRDNRAKSEDIATLNTVVRRNGKVYDSTKRPWGIRLYDLLSPF